MDPLDTVLGIGFLAVYLFALVAPPIFNRIGRHRLDKQASRSSARSLISHFRAAGRQLGLTLARGGADQGPALCGHIESCETIVDSRPSGGNAWTTTVVVRPAVPLLSDVSIHTRWQPVASTSHDVSAGEAPEMATGDVAFDALLQLGGHLPSARALLTPTVRSMLTALARTGAVRVDRRGLAYELHERPWTPEAIVALVRQVVAAALRFPRVSDVFAAVAEAAHGDPEPGVRAHCLATLLEEKPDEPRTAATLETGLLDRSDTVRVVAARALGERGVPVLREIAMRIDNEQQTAARAIAVLGRRLTCDETLALLDSALGAGRGTVAFAAIDSLGRMGDGPACERLCSLLCGRNEGLAVSAADALGFVHSPAVEDQLDQALLSASPLVRHAAVHALGRVGRHASIAPLRALIESSPSIPDLISAAHEAIAAIQSRLTDATPGRLSLAEGESGDLSLAEGDASGRLSLPREPPPG